MLACPGPDSSRVLWSSSYAQSHHVMGLMWLCARLMLSGSWWARCVRGNSCLSRAACPVHVWHWTGNQYDSHVIQQFWQWQLQWNWDQGRPGGRYLLISPNKSFLGIMRSHESLQQRLDRLLRTPALGTWSHKYIYATRIKTNATYASQATHLKISWRVNVYLVNRCLAAAGVCLGMGNMSHCYRVLHAVQQ